MTEGLLRAVKRFWVEETATSSMLPVERSRDQRTRASDERLGTVLRTTVVERSSGEEPATSSMLPFERPSSEVHVASGLHSAIGVHPPVDRSSTGELETDDALTEPRRASRTPSAYRASTETDTEVIVPVMNTMAGGPSVDRTLTGGGETLAFTSAQVAEEPRGDPTMVESFTPRIGAATQDSKVGRSSDGQGRPPIVWGQGIPIRLSKNLPQPSDPSSRPSATLPISPASVSEAISRMQQEKTRLQKNLDQKQAEHDALTYNMYLLRNERDFFCSGK